MISTEASTLGETLLMSGIWLLIAAASPRVRVLVPWVPVRTPFTARPPASIQTKLSPRLLSCCSTWAWPAFPMATTQITAAIPMVTPRTVRTLRILFRSSAQSAPCSRAVRFMKLPLGQVGPAPVSYAGRGRRVGAGGEGSIGRERETGDSGGGGGGPPPRRRRGGSDRGRG